MQKLKLNMHYLVPTSCGLLAATQTRHQIAGTTLNQISTGTAATRQISYFWITSPVLTSPNQLRLTLVWYPLAFPDMAPIQKPIHWPLLQCSTPLASVTMLHPTGLSYNAPPHWPLLQCSTPLASLTMLHPTGLCYNAPPHWPLLQCSTPLASVTMLHPCLRMTVSLQAHDGVIKC